ncbi:FUSC family membrane protein, partial [Escherichia coli]|uniref:FUSC family membrane protein n=1 Tax=Escherichia coli TaxID=562 RepID=UPI002542650C
RGTRRTLHYHFVAQDIHERASSAHIQYHVLRERLRYSDVMFRFQRLLSMQGQACQALARSILLRTPYQYDSRFERAFVRLDAAISRIPADAIPDAEKKAIGFL